MDDSTARSLVSILAQPRCQSRGFREYEQGANPFECTSVGLTAKDSQGGNCAFAASIKHDTNKTSLRVVGGGGGGGERGGERGEEDGRQGDMDMETWTHLDTPGHTSTPRHLDTWTL